MGEWLGCPAQPFVGSEEPFVSPQVTASGALRDVRGRSLSSSRVLLGQGEVKGSAAPPSGCASPSVGSQR